MSKCLWSEPPCLLNVPETKPMYKKNSSSKLSESSESAEERYKSSIICRTTPFSIYLHSFRKTYGY